jgi:hypothetical protein
MTILMGTLILDSGRVGSVVTLAAAVCEVFLEVEQDTRHTIPARIRAFFNMRYRLSVIRIKLRLKRIEKDGRAKYNGRVAWELKTGG